ncbi:hypothetical protein JQM97_03315 [Prevotella hominis]|uniref:LPD38 domain-containing protein n=1 Tax=Segatella hominis TaxID=2518605 RepID=UPI001F26AB03|nr:LPD38 domain-containing protein [Segatella hominis]MCF2589987.1 hypothetical protein [Segatella hominis]
MAERPLYTLYRNLKAQNYDVPDDYNKFESALTRDGKSGADNRHAIYENLKAQNFDVPDTYERFYSALFEPRSKTSSRAKGGSVPMSAADRARYLSVTQSVLNTARQVKRASGNIRKTVERAKKFNANDGNVTIGFKNPLQNKNVQKNKFNYNSTTGKTGTYTTTDGVEFDNEYDASQHQNKLDKYGEEWNKAVDMGMVPSELDKADPDLSDTDVAMRQMERRQEWLNENQNRRSKELNESMHLQGSPFVASGGAVAPSSFNAAISNEANRLSDVEYGAYNTAKAYNQMLRTTLLQELKEQKQRNENAGWWKDKWNDVSNYFGGMLDTMFNPKLFSQGVMDAAMANNMLQVKKGMEDGTIKKGSNAGNAAQAMLGAIQQQQGESAKQQQNGAKAYQYGDMSGRSLKFMGDFLTSGWRNVMTTGFTKAGEKVGEKMALGTLGKWFTKNTGRVLGDMAGSAALAATNQLGSTYNNVIERYVGMNNENGGVTQDKNGDLKFNEGVSLGKAIKDGFGSATIENFSEMFGEYLPGASKLLSKLGLSKVSSFFEKIGNNAYYKWLSNATNKSGIQGVMSEISEEEFGTALHAAWGDGDGSWSDFNVFTNPDAREKQIDTCLGMFYSVGFMQAPRTAVGAINAVQYFKIKHQVNKADKFGQGLFNDNWDEIKSKIDVSTNADLTKTVLDATRSDSMTAKQKGAVINYAMFLSKLRGFNQASDAKTKDKVEEGDTAPTLSNDLDDAYTEGHNADDADKHDIQIQHEDQAKTLAAALNISEQQLSGMSDEELESMTGQDDKLDQAIYDYQLSSARYQGVVDDAQDKVDLAAHQAAQKVDMYTDRSRGSVRNATIKASGGAEDYGVYIISGNIATNDDGSIDVINSDDMILYYDPTTNSVEHDDASMFAELGEELPADDVKAQAVADAKENAIKEIAGIIDGTVEVGSQFSVTDADGTEHTYEVLADNGDGTAMITIDGNVPTELVNGENVQISYSFADLQKMKDLEDQKRLEAAKAEREQMEKERAAQQTQETEQTQPSFDFNQILNDNGNVVLVDVLDKDGNTKYPDSKLFLIRDAGAKAKVVELKSDGTIVPHAVNKEDVATISSMSLDEYKQAMPESSMIEDNSGEESDEDSQLANLGLPKGSEIWMSGDGFGRPKENTLSRVVGIDEKGSIILEDKDGKKWSASFDYINNHRELPPLDENTNIVNEENNQSESNAEENTTATEQTPAITLEDGTIVPILDDGNPDFSKLTAAQTAELYDNQFGEDADSILSGYVSDAKKALDKANNMTVKGKTFVEQKASKDAKEKAIADAQAAYDSAIAIRDAYNERQLAKVEDTADGRKNLIEKARRKFARLKSAVKDDAEAVAQIYKETVGSLLHRLYDSTGIDVTDTIPLTAEEYVASNLGAHSLNYEGTETSKSVKQETGLSREDFAKTQLLAADGKGTTIDALVHSLWENRPSNLDSLDTQDIRNALIGVLTSGFKASEARSYVENIRIAQAEKLIEEERTAAENAAYYEQQKAKEEEEKKKAELEKKSEEEKKKAELDGYEANPLAERVTETDEEVESDGKYGTIYNKVYLIDGDKRVTKVDEPDANGNYTGSYYMYDGKRFGDLFEVADYIDGKAEEKNFPDKLQEGSKDIEVPEDATDDAPLGKQLDETDLPFSAKENGTQQTTAERAADVEKNKVDDMKVVDNIVGKKTRKAFERLAKMMGANIQWQYSDELGNGWIQETTDADGNVHRTIFITLDSSITEGAQFIFGHEMTHQIKNLNPAAYNELTQLVLETYGSDAFDKAVDETMKRYSDAGFSGRNRDYYAEEVVADAVGEMIRDLNLAHTLAMKMSHPLLAAIHEILQKIKLAFYGTEYSDVTKNIIRSIEQAYVKTANGQVTNSETGEDVSFSLRQKPEPKKKGVGYKVFVLKDGKLYPPMVANPDGAATPVGVWLDADAAPIAGESKTGRPQVKQGGKGTQGGSGKLAYRPGWHLGVVPYAIQFNRKDADGNKTLFPKNFVFAEVEYAADVDYQEEARQEGINPSGKYQHSLAGLKHLPTDGYYMYRTNPNPETDPWVITGAMKVNRILTRAEQAELVKKAGREPQQIQEGDIVTDDVVNSINQEIADAPKFSIKTYHGSQASFDHFDHSFMGSGEGAQAYGWGTYVSEVEGIAKAYAKQNASFSRISKISKYLGTGKSVVNAMLNPSTHKKTLLRLIDNAIRTNEAIQNSTTFEPMLEEAKKALSELKTAKEMLEGKTARNLYYVEIPDDTGDNYLGWDEPLNAKQIGMWKKALLSVVPESDRAYYEEWADGMLENRKKENNPLTGKDAYYAIDSKYASKKTSMALSKAGFVGVKVIAQRNTGGNKEGKMNYVIFDENNAKITNHTKFSLRLKSAIEETETNPSDAQKESGNYKKGHIKFGGYDYTIENPKGSTRSGNDVDGKEWKVTMHDTYGYIRGKFGKDGDHLDMFINDKADLDNWNGDVFVVDQVNPDGSFDEHKVMYGYDSMDDAEKAYLANYSKGWKGLGNITGASKTEFDKWIDTSNRKLKPFADYAKVKFSQAQSVSEPRYSLKDEKIKSVAEKFGVNKDDVAMYANAVEKGSTAEAARARANIKRYLLQANEDKISSFKDIIKYTKPINEALKENFGDLDAMIEERRKQVEAQRNAMEAARKIAQEEEEKRQKHLDELSLIPTDELDKRYMDAIANNDESTAREMLDESARRNGYGDVDSDYQGKGAWAAPSNPQYESDEARRADIENSPDVNLEDIALGYNLQPDDYFDNPRAYMNNTAYGLESAHVIKNALDAIKNGEKDVKVKVYRAVPTSVKEGKLRNGDWVTPSKKYAEMHGGNRLEGKYRIIEDEVPANQLWWDGNDVNEFGFDDGKEYRYKNAKNNRKLNDLITYDNNGNVIPPSKRFNSRKSDIRFSLAGERGAAAADKADERTFRMDNLSVAKEMEKNKKKAKAIKAATGWERGADGKWRYEMPDVVLRDPKGWVNKKTLTLSDIVEKPNDLFKDYPELFDAYPELKDMKILKGRAKSGGVFYNNAITLNLGDIREAIKYDLDTHYKLANNSLKKTLVHEIQHYIQEQEGFAKGGNSEMIVDKNALDAIAKLRAEKDAVAKEFYAMSPDEQQRRKYEINRRYNDLTKQIERLEKSNRIGYDGYQRLAGEVEARNVSSRLNMTPEERRKTLAESTEDVARKDQIFLGVGDVSFSLRDMADGKESGVANMAEDLNSLNTPDEVDDAIKTAIDDMPSGWQMANKKIIHIAHALGENRKAEIAGEEPKFSIRTYHGTGAIFDKFDLSHALEGEGSESFGHGVYVTNSSKIGREYAQRAKQRKMADLYKNMRYPDGVKGDIFKRRVFGEMVNDVATGGSVASAKEFAKKRIGADANDIQRTLENLKDREKGTEYEQNLKDRLAEYKEGLKWIGSLDEDYLTQGNANRYDVDIPDDNGSNYLDWEGTIPDSLDKQKVTEDAYKVVSDNQGFKDSKVTTLNDFITHTLKTYVDTTDVSASVEKLKSDIKDVIEDDFADDDVLALNEYLKDATTDDVLATIWYNDLVRDIDNAETGEELYRKLSTYVGDNAASQILSDNGLVGIKYPAGMIHGGAEEGDYNYVIFDENNANIVGNTRFSLRYDKFEHDLNQWKKDNNLPKDAQRPTIPQRNVGESAVDFLRRVDEYRKQMALWKTAPTYEQHLLSDDTALGEFNRELQRGSVLKRIAFQDSMLAIRKAQEAIMKEVGVDRLNMAEDAYTAENRSHGKGKNEFEEYNNEFLQPLRKAYHQMKKVLGDSYDNVRIYMMAKHGLERDAQMAFKKSLEADYEDVAQRSAAYKAYKGDMNRIINDSDLEFGRVDFNTWRQKDDALRAKYSPSYMNYSYDKDGTAYDYSGLSALFGGTDFEEAAHKLVRDIESSHVVEVQDLWNATNAATKKILRDGYKAGMMSKDTYQYVRDMYSNYIPLRGWDGTTADQVWDYIGGGKGAFNQTLKTAHGRTSIADDPIAYIENMAESGILLNNKNWVKQHLMLLAQNHPTSLLTLSKAWYVKSTDANGNEEWIPATPQITSQMDSNQVKAAIDAFEQKMEQMAQTGDATQKRDGLNIAYPQTHSEEREHEVRVMKDGEEYVIYVNGDPQLAQAMNNTRAHRVREIQSGKLDRAAAWLGRKMAAAYTSLSPLFIPSNYFRDLTMTLASTAIREDGRYNYLLRKNLATSWNLGFMLIDYQNGKLREKVNNGNATPKEQMFYDFMMNGGETGFVSSLDVEDLKKKFKNDLKDLDRWKVNPVKVGHTIMDSIEFLNRAIEDSNRFAVYMTSIQYGRSIDEAVNDAKNVTLNFNRKGTGEYGWQMIRNLYLFINPAVQSLQTLGALAKHNPFKFTAVTASWLASGVLVPIVNAALMSLFGGDDDKDKYWQFSKWDRRNNFIMWIPTTNEFVKIPLAQEFRAFYGLGDMIASKMMGGELAEESWSQYAEDLLGQVVDMLPLDPTGYDGNIAVSLMPNPIRPIFELAFNVDFTGKPLFKDTEYNKYDPNFTKAYVGTPDWLVRVSKMVNSIGNDYPDVQQNSIDAFGNPRYNLNNPAVVDHVLSSYLGGSYTMGSQVLGLLTKSLNDPKEIKVADIPLFSKFVSNPDDRPVTKKQGDEFWNMKENHDRAANTLSKLKKQAKVDGDYSMLERFYGSEEYKQYKQDDVKVKKYEEDKKKERAEESGEEYRPHKLNAEDIYKAHATPKDDFEDLKLKQLYTKLNGFKTSYDLLVDTAPSQSDGYYNTNKAAIDAIDEISLDKQEISELKKGFLDDGKDAYNAEDMKQIRELRKKILAVLEKANKVVVANQKVNAKKK